jgi:hypothetical protein
MNLPKIQKTSVIQYILMNNISKEYYDGEGYTTTELLKAKKYDVYSIANRSKEEMDEPSEWEILEVEISCEIKGFCD